MSFICQCLRFSFVHCFSPFPFRVCFHVILIKTIDSCCCPHFPELWLKRWHHSKQTEWLIERLTGRFREQTAALPAEPNPASACPWRNAGMLPWSDVCSLNPWDEFSSIPPPLPSSKHPVWCQSLRLRLHWKILSLFGLITACLRMWIYSCPVL